MPEVPTKCKIGLHIVSEFTLLSLCAAKQGRKWHFPEWKRRPRRSGEKRSFAIMSPIISLK